MTCAFIEEGRQQQKLVGEELMLRILMGHG